MLYGYGTPEELTGSWPVSPVRHAAGDFGLHFPEGCAGILDTIPNFAWNLDSALTFLKDVT